jgi:hypothetical protein
LEGVAVRQAAAFDLAVSAFEREDFGEARLSFEYLAEISSDAFSATPQPTSVATHLAALTSLRRIAVREGRLADALSVQLRAVDLARRLPRNVKLISELASLADIQRRLGNAAATDEAWIERESQCATLIAPPLQEGEPSSYDRLLERLVSAECDFTTDAPLHVFERRVSELSGQGSGENGISIQALGDALFFLGYAREARFDTAGGLDAYRRSLELRRERPEIFATTAERRDLTPYLLARLGNLPGEEAAWRLLKQWLDREGSSRPLTADEQRLLILAGERLQIGRDRR